MNEKTQALVKLVTDNPKTTAFGLVGITLLGGGELAGQFGFELVGKVIEGLGAAVLLITSLFAKDPKKPQDPPAA